MKLRENQLHLLRHLTLFGLLDYPACLNILDTDKTGERRALSYAFRPLTKNRYLSKRKDGSVAILAKGRALFPKIKPLISVGGSAGEICRVMEVSRMAALLEECGIFSSGTLLDTEAPYFIPSACWRKVASGILSTTRFTGMLMLADRCIAVYDIGDGNMEWQLRAESSLFYTRYGSYETKADGMLLACREELRNRVAENIIRQTMWHRRQLIHSGGYAERNRPVRWSHSPIRLRAQYEHVYLTTPGELKESIQNISLEKAYVCAQCADGTLLNNPAQGNYERWPYRYFVNIATDLLGYVYYFSAAMSLLAMRENPEFPTSELNYSIITRKRDFPILRMYPDVVNMEGGKFYVYRPEENPAER